jgi:enterochelin esterase family protein
MSWQRRLGLSLAPVVALGVIAALTVARERQGPKLLKAKRERAEIQAHELDRYAVPLEPRDCALGTLTPLQDTGSKLPAAQDMQLVVREPGTDRALRQFELKKAALEFGFCVDAPGTYVLELQAGDTAGGYELALEAVLARPPLKLDVLTGDPQMSPRVRALAAALPDPERVKELCGELARDGSPLIEPADADNSWVSFFYLASPATRSVSVSWSLWWPALEDAQLTRFPGTNLWWKSVRLPSSTRFSYQLTIDPPTVPRSNEALFDRAQAAVSLADPWNKAPMLVEHDAYVRLSTVQLTAAAPERWRDPKLEPAPGRLDQHNLASERLGHTHALSVYVPAGYDQAREQRFPLLIFFDGDSYLHDEDTKTLLDALIAQRAIAPLVALFVINDEPSQRATELPCNATFAAFVADELLPFARAHYRVSQDAEQIGLAGLSFGGLASSFIALHYPDRFGKVLSQSGSYWWTFEQGSPQYDGVDSAAWLRRRYSERPVGKTQFYMSAGLFEGSPDGSGVLEENRAMRDALRALGYSVAYQEFAGGHDHLAWRASLPDGLIALYGSR